MPIKLIEHRIQPNHKRLEEAGVQDFFQGFAQGAADAFKKSVGLKTSDELAQEAEKAYNSWFNSKGFKEYECNEEGVFKAYILPLGNRDEGIIFKFKLTPESAKYIEGKTDDEIKDDHNIKTQCEISMFNVPLDLNGVKTIAPAIIGDADFNGIDTLLQKENATLVQANPLPDKAVEYLNNLNTNVIRKFNLNLFDTKLTMWEKSAFQNLLKNGNTDTLDDVVTTQLANNLSRKQETIEGIAKIGNYGETEQSVIQMAQDFAKYDPKNEKLYNALINKSSLQEIAEIIQSQQVTYDYQYRMLVMAISRRLNDDNIRDDISSLFTRGKIKKRR